MLEPRLREAVTTWAKHQARKGTKTTRREEGVGLSTHLFFLGVREMQSDSGAMDDMPWFTDKHLPLFFVLLFYSRYPVPHAGQDGYAHHIFIGGPLCRGTP